MNKLSQARNVIKHRLPGAPNSWTLEIFCWCFWSALWSRINMVAEDGNFYFRKTSLGTGFSACNCLFDSRNCLLHLWYWASTINWIGQNGPLQFFDSWGHYFTPANRCKLVIRVGVKQVYPCRPRAWPRQLSIEIRERDLLLMAVIKLWVLRMWRL